MVEAGEVTEVTSINIGPIKIGQTLPQFTTVSASPQLTLNQNFGEPPTLTLLGFDLVNDHNQALAEGRLANNESLKLVLYWRPNGNLSVDYTAFVHVRDETGETIAQKDQPPLGGAYPTSLWDPGEIISDEITVPLPPNLAPGQYQLVVGLYDFDTDLLLAKYVREFRPSERYCSPDGRTVRFSVRCALLPGGWETLGLRLVPD